ncbi:MAG: glycolate oxidase subunit GlcE [Burkholderiaceae bacterium]
MTATTTINSEHAPAAPSADAPTLAELTDRIRTASDAGTPLRIRGGGTKDFYGAGTAGGSYPGEPLSTLGMTGIVSYEPTELVVTARAGTSLSELEAALDEKGQCLPFEPPHFSDLSSSDRQATIGGMVAAGLSGPARASVGAVRDYVLGAQLLNGRGELLTFGGTVMKNVAGYDVSRLLVGSLGVLGVIVEVSLKVLPKANAEATLKFELTQAEALQRLNEWGGQPLPLNASCWVQEASSGNAAAGAGMLYLRLRGAVAAVDAACKRLGGERVADAQAASDWAACREQQLPWFNERRADQDLWRLSVPQTAPVLDLPEAPFIEWHGAQRWLRTPRDAQMAERLRAAANAGGGHASIFIAKDEHSTRAPARFDSIKPPLDRIQRNLKASFDPAGIFNRGRLTPDY